MVIGFGFARTSDTKWDMSGQNRNKYADLNSDREFRLKLSSVSAYLQTVDVIDGDGDGWWFKHYLVYGSDPRHESAIRLPSQGAEPLQQAGVSYDKGMHCWWLTCKQAVLQRAGSSTSSIRCSSPPDCACDA
jgi:hypothetical protein